MVNDYLNNIIGCIYKVLPLKEEKNNYLPDYIDSLLVQLKGAAITYPLLSSNSKYISVINSIQYFCNNDFTDSQCKREVFKCIDYIKKIQSEV